MKAAARQHQDPQRTPQGAALDPALVRLIEALAQADADRDYAAAAKARERDDVQS
ncbi:hypothetical protein OVA11_19255 [Caulobacter sp. SL161]|uniref:hypothetical protein n=1 Tax=Caulobacter sp. SL161 TaxID=2995156 RepID=UPI002273B4D5|nr:hypothetical protein [Caulobacter sp. SL161]MCY1649117.1 hypothetical protein [Caulobacter sp. SL161]